MSLKTLLHSVSNAVTGFWDEELDLWLKNFLGNIVHAEAQIAVTAAETYVQQALPALVNAVTTGDYAGFADAQATVIAATAKDLLASGEKVGITAVSTAVTALIAGHPDIVVAANPPVVDGAQ